MNIRQALTHKIDGYKIDVKLTDEEYSKFKVLFLDWHVWLDGVGDPMELPATWEIFKDIAAQNKPKLDAYVEELHIKYGTDNKTHGIFKGHLVWRNSI